MNRGRDDPRGPGRPAGRLDPNRPVDILFVCTGNICRSPMAQQLLLAALGTGPDAARYRVTSAGTHGYDGQDMDPPAAAELRRLGGDSAGFRSRALTDRACKAADLILTATREQRSIVLDRVPSALRRSFTLLEFAQSIQALPTVPMAGNNPVMWIPIIAAERGNHRFASYDVTDPYRGTADVHRHVADTILGAVDIIAAQLRTPPPRPH